MTREEWKKCYDELYGIYSEYYGINTHYKNGKTKLIRNNAEEKLRIIIKRAEKTICDNGELLYLVEQPDEMFSLQHFMEDLQNLLMKVEEQFK